MARPLASRLGLPGASAVLRVQTTPHATACPPSFARVSSGGYSGNGYGRGGRRVPNEHTHTGAQGRVQPAIHRRFAQRCRRRPHGAGAAPPAPRPAHRAWAMSVQARLCRGRSMGVVGRRRPVPVLQAISVRGVRTAGPAGTRPRAHAGAPALAPARARLLCPAQALHGWARTVHSRAQYINSRHGPPVERQPPAQCRTRLLAATARRTGGAGIGWSSAFGACGM
mmetsp:Transcript_3125/g.10580  ORF Transcript_3125/g.10580 Transcript_3125/m.10580 type:complete len:225 (-) Transcript_3125:265-939(-)